MFGFGAGIPSWLAGLTGAGKFANNPLNGMQPTIGDAFQGIGHSMANNYRQGQAGGGQPQVMPQAPQAKGPDLTPQTFPPVAQPSGGASPGVPGWTPKFNPMAPETLPPEAVLEALMRKFPQGHPLEGGSPMGGGLAPRRVGPMFGGGVQY